MNEDIRYKDHEWLCGYSFVKWGVGFFLLGLLFGFGVLIHYLMGSKTNTTDGFLSNVTLWFGSPLTLSSGYLQVGGLAMAVVGLAKKSLSKCCCPGCDAKTLSECTSCDSRHGRCSLTLCVAGLIALFITGYIGYFVINNMWPGFYYTPIQAGKNLWLILQGLSLAVYFIGLLCAFCCLCKCRHCHSCKTIK